VKLMFLTRRGSVLGAAEMLSPVTWGLQPFKFVRLHDDDERRLQAAIQSSLDKNRRDHGRIPSTGGREDFFLKIQPPGCEFYKKGCPAASPRD